MRAFQFIMFSLLINAFLFFNGFAQKTYIPSKTTKIAFLGTGTPYPDPQHSGISVAIIVNHTPYIVDFGPELIRKAASLYFDLLI